MMSEFDTEPHGAGSGDLPDIVTPEIFMDRYTHNQAFYGIMKIEAALEDAKPLPSVVGSYVEVRVSAIFNGRVGDIIKQQYLDKGWATITLIEVDATTTAVKLVFP
jgi:hypothetical protein